MKLLNLNNPNSFVIESYSNMLTSGLTFAVVGDKVFLTLNDNRYVNVELTYNEPLESQIFSLFELAKTVKNVYEQKEITRGLFRKDSYIFTEKRNYFAAPIWLHSNRIPDIFLLKTNCETDCEQTCNKCGNCEKCKCIYGDVKLGFDIKNHPIRQLLFDYLRKAESSSWKVVDIRNSLINLYKINGLDISIGQFTSTFTTQRQNQGTSSHICSTTEPPSAIQFDSQFADHSKIFYLFPKDKIITPYIFNFEFYFDDELEKTTTQGLYYNETSNQEFNFDIPSINRIFNMNIDEKRNNIDDETFNTFKYNNNFWNTSTELISPNSKTNQLIFKDKNGIISGAEIKNKNLVEIDFNNSINFNDILGVIHKQNPAYNPIHYVYDENYSNIKMKLTGKFNEGERIMLKNDAYKIEILGIATENDCCDELLECVNYSGDYVQKFTSKEVIQERTLLKVVVPKLVILKNYDNISIRIGIDEFNSKIYNVRHNKDENETIFNIHIKSFPRHLMQIQDWEFTYKMSKVYYFTFNPNQKSIDVLNEINDELNKIGLTNSFVDKDALIICRKSYNFLLEVVTKNTGITLNDYNFRQHIVENNNNIQKFNYNYTEFSGTTSGNNLIVFIPTKNDLELGKNSLVQIKGINYELNSYKLYDEITDYYTNFYLKNVLYLDYKGVIILNYDEKYNGELATFLEKFQPKIYELEVF